MNCLSFGPKLLGNELRLLRPPGRLNRTQSFRTPRKAFRTALAITMTDEKDQRPVFFFDIDNCVSKLIPDFLKRLTSVFTALF
jgi:hypothetical protein